MLIVKWREHQGPQSYNDDPGLKMLVKKMLVCSEIANLSFNQDVSLNAAPS